MNATRPTKTRSYYPHHIIDGTRWDHYRPRRDDIIVSTSMKAGTTWVQTIVANLLYQDGTFPAPVDTMAPWLDMRFAPIEMQIANLEAQTGRRSLKTHLPLNAIPFYDEVKYVVVGRDGRDVFMSLHNHHTHYSDKLREMVATVDSTIGHPFAFDLGDIKAMWRQWTTRGYFAWESDGYPYWSHLYHFQTWWDFKHLSNIYFVHYADLLANPTGEIQRLAEFLAIPVTAAKMPEIVERISFTAMRENFDNIMPMANVVWQGGGNTFMNKGTNGRWRDIFDGADLALYDQAVARNLTPEAARWLEFGRG
ncbi:MAG: sulfotransferase domain-containing protein [Gammaproteobacteria bacterium]|nr:sulfotransferase domain-containing protein [Gammaproteobacteria bacterium]